MRKWLVFAACGLIAVVAVVVGASSRDSTSRVERISREVRCPQCSGLSAWESDAPAAQAVQEFVRTEVAAGKSDAEIKAELERRFGADILLRPKSSGTSALVWALPVVAVVLAGAGLGFAFVRWRGGKPWPVVTAVGAVVVAVGAGVLVTRVAGERLPGEAATGSAPTTVTPRDALVDQGIALEQEGKVLDALKSYDAAIKENPNNVVALTYKGWLLGRQNNEELVKRGLESLDKAITIDPTFADPYAFRGLIRARSRDAKGICDLRRYLAIAPVTSVQYRAVETALDEASKTMADPGCEPLPTPVTSG